MPIIAKGGGSDFKPAPAGPALAVCCDVVDLGVMKSSFQNKDGSEKHVHKIRVVWQLADKDDEIGKRPICSRMYTLSLGEKATLRAHLESWRGRTFTPDELKGFDVERVIAAPALLNIVHDTKDGKTWANVHAVMPPQKGSPKVVIEDYVRVKDRQPEPEEREPGSDDDEQGAEPPPGF